MRVLVRDSRDNTLAAIKVAGLCYDKETRSLYVQHDGGIFEIPNVGAVGADQKILELYSSGKCDLSHTPGTPMEKLPECYGNRMSKM